jgi:hypothetical protein
MLRGIQHIGIEASAGGAVNYLLDQYPGAGFAYAFKRFKASYNGNNIRARENSNEDNIALLTEALDTSSLLTFAGGNDAFLPIIHDQTSNANNLTQTTANNQLKIVDAGALVTSGGHAATQGTGVTGGVTSNIAFSGMTDIWFFEVMEVVTSGSNQFFYESSTNFGQNSGAFLIAITGGDLVIFNKRGTANLTNIYPISAGRQLISIRIQNNVNFATFSQVFINGTEITKSSVNGFGDSELSDQILYVGARGGITNGFQGKRQASIFYPFGQSANRTGIETILKNLYGTP